MYRKLRVSLTIILSGVLATFSCLTVFASINKIDNNATQKAISNVSNALNETSQMENYGVEEDPYRRLTVDEPDLVEPALAAKYDPRENGFLTEVKDQSGLSLCWSFASASLAEQFVSKNYGRKFDISELHAAVALSNSINSNGTGSGYYTTDFNQGAYFPKVAQYYTMWNEPIFNNYINNWSTLVSEESFPKSLAFNNNSVESDIDIENTQFATSPSLFNITDIKYIKNDKNTIKYFIKNCGAVYTNFNFKGSYAYDSNNDMAYNSNLIGSTHAVNIVGWDDNYPKENFNSDCRPQNDGAWLIKNSWGYSYTSTGYIWISYEETSLISQEYMNVILGVQRANDNEYMLANDFYPLGCEKKEDANNTEEKKYVNERVYMANVYDVSDYTDEYSHINKVMFYLKAIDCTYNIRILQLTNNLLPSNLDNVPILASGSYSGEGYITETLDSNFYFTSNNKCAVILEIIPNSSNSQIYFPKETHYVVPAEINTYESLYFVDSENSDSITWMDNVNDNINKADNDKYGNFCIRPIIKKRTSSSHNVTFDTTEITDTSVDNQINITSDCVLFSVHTKNNKILRQDFDYTYNNGVVVLKKEYLATLGDNCTEIVFEFSNDVTRIVTVNPQADISKVEIIGSPIVGDTLYAKITAIPEKEEYDLTYQWQYSGNGTSWNNISGATNEYLTLSNLLINNYIRLVVSSNNFGNVVYPFTYETSSTLCKVVVLGDVDQNGMLNLKDATLIQKYISNIVLFNQEQMLAADYNRDGKINVMDSTAIRFAINS